MYLSDSPIICDHLQRIWLNVVDLSWLPIKFEACIYSLNIFVTNCVFVLTLQ